jgi:hypothetical protein
VFEVEIFTPTGVLTGETARLPLTNDGPDLAEPLAVADARWYPIDGAAPAQRDQATVAPDDILLIVTPAPELLVHMAWYAVTLELGPYRVSGRLATHPGFDPEKALARPGSTFIPLSDATVELLDVADDGAAERAHIHVNRYAVESVTSALMLAHFFPGARLVAQEAEAAAGGVPAPSARRAAPPRPLGLAASVATPLPVAAPPPPVAAPPAVAPPPPPIAAPPAIAPPPPPIAAPPAIAATMGVTPSVEPPSVVPPPEPVRQATPLSRLREAMPAPTAASTPRPLAPSPAPGPALPRESLPVT